MAKTTTHADYTATALTLTTAAQPNITSVGTLTSFRSTGIDDNADALAITIDSSENVGIGTTSPTNVLHIKTTVNNTAVATIESTATDSYPFLRLKNDAREYQLTCHGSLSDAFTIYDGTAGAHRLTITSAGNVGIGTTSSSAGLHTVVDNNPVAEFSRGSNNTTNINLDYNTTLTGQLSAANEKFQISAAGSGTEMEFYTNGTKALEIDTTGALGIKKIPPSGLHTGWSQIFIGEKGSLISENANSGGLYGTWLTDNMYVKSSTGAFAYITTDESSAYRQEAGVHQWYTQASGSADAAVTLSEKMRIDSSGHVGIGMTPAAVGSDTVLAVYNSATPRIKLHNSTTGSTSSDGGEINMSSSDLIIENREAGNQRFFTNGSERMRIDSSGGIGFGTTSPTHPLHISIAASNDTIDETKGLVKFQSSGGNGLIFGTIASSPYSSYIQSAYVIDTSIAQYNLALNPIGGNVCIGATSGTGILNVDGGSGEGSLYVEGTASGSAITARLLASDGGAVFFGSNTSHDLRFQTGGTTRATIDTVGDLTVGTSSAGFHFDNSQQLFTTTFGTGGNLTLAVTNSSGSGDGGEIFLGGSTRGDTLRNCIVFRRGSGTQSMLIDASGNVTIAGSLSKGSGSFKIDHPLESKKDTHHLVHSYIEGPQADNIYRGVVTLENGTATINLDTVSGMTEGTFVALNTDIQCFTSNETDWDSVKGSISGNILTISCQNTSSTATVSWLVIGERQDQHMLDADWTDENGKVIVEPLKESE